jgi:hypothetical protein
MACSSYQRPEGHKCDNYSPVAKSFPAQALLSKPLLSFLELQAMLKAACMTSSLTAKPRGHSDQMLMNKISADMQIRSWGRW